MNIGYEVNKYMKLNRLKPVGLSKLSGVLQSELSDIIHNRRKLSIRTAKLIEKHLIGFDAEMILHAQLDNEINRFRMKQKHYVYDRNLQHG